MRKIYWVLLVSTIFIAIVFEIKRDFFVDFFFSELPTLISQYQPRPPYPPYPPPSPLNLTPPPPINFGNQPTPIPVEASLQSQLNNLNGQVVVISYPGNPNLFLFNPIQKERLINIFDKQTWKAIPQSAWAPTLAESLQGRRDIFIAPDGRHAVGLNETTAVFFDLTTLKEVKTVKMPSDLMAYKNLNGMLYYDNPAAPAWATVNPGTRWLSNTEFQMALYRIRGYRVTMPWRNMVIDWSK